MGAKKNFVLDTNVILHDYKCLGSFEENDVYIPIVVFEELDKFKKGNEQINYNAREFIRSLDSVMDDKMFKEGTQIAPDKGKLFVLTGELHSDKVCSSFPCHLTDNKILTAVHALAEKYPEMKTILVSKDINLRLKARSLGLFAEDYITDKVMNIDIFDREQDTFEIEEAEIIDEIYASKGGVTLERVKLTDQVVANQCFVLKSYRSTVLCRYNPFTKKIVKVDKGKNYGIEARNAEQSFSFDVLNDPKVKLVALTGRAGTGKTLLALASALKQNQDYKQILLARPIVGLAGKDLGFLPGDEKQKVAPYMQPLFDNLNVIKHQFSAVSQEVRHIEDMQRSEQIVIEALAYIRGRSLSETFFIIDEAQNLTPHEVKTIITRAGEGTKMIFTGDIMQIDSPYLDAQSNGLAYMIDKMKGQELFAHVNLVKGERSELSELASNLL